jgi:hypothetical protein
MGTEIAVNISRFLSITLDEIESLIKSPKQRQQNSIQTLY